MAGTEKDFKIKKGLIVTEGITLGGHTFDDIDITSEASDADDHLMTALAIKNRIEDYGYSTTAGTVTSVTAGTGMTQSGTSTVNPTLTVGAGNGITVNTNDVAITAAQTTITSVLNTGLVIGRDSTDQIKFSTDNQIIFRVGNADGVTFKASGEIEATKFDGALEGNADTASVASRVVVVANDAAGSFVNENNLILFSPDGTASNDGGNLTPESSTDFHYNPSSTVLTVPKITGDVTGDVTGTATNATAITLGGHLINDVDIGTELVDTDDHIMSSGAIKAYVDANAGGGATALNGLTDVISNITNFTDSILISPDGAAPPHGTLSNAHSNVGIGKDALSVVASGSSNVALGFNAMKSFTTGYKSVAIGYRAMDSTTAVAQGVAIGADAGRNMTATNAVVIGAVAGTNLTSGAGSVFIGEGAGYGVTTEAHNIAIGSMALSSSNLSGATYNIGIGSFVGYDITSGDYNIGMGAFSLRELESGSSNLMFGKNSGMNITTGNRNIGIGGQSYDGATSESDNIAIGYDALGGSVAGAEYTVAIGNYTLDALTSGDNNTAVGHNSATALIEGNHNTAIGSYSYFRATDGTYNCVIGQNSGGGLRSGSYNIAMGFNTMGQVNNDGDYNVAIGTHSMNAATGNDVNYNTAIGTSSLQSITSGAKNIALGQTAGNNITSGDFNVVIGAADVASATGDSQLSISSGDGGVTWITGASTGAVDIPTALEVGTGTQPLPANGVVTIINDDSDTTKTLLLVDNESDATNGPVLTLYRNTASLC
jgi:hypothetical protein